jgi:hypothetical protein
MRARLKVEKQKAKSEKKKIKAPRDEWKAES